jgi:hypothetical protein
MTHNPKEPRGGTEPTDPAKSDPFTAGEAALDRAKAVARRITERCEQLTGGTQIDHRSLPPDPTEKAPPAT